MMSSDKEPKDSLIDEMMEKYSCIFYPMCFKARELLYCPKKAGKQECEDYRPRPASEPAPEPAPECKYPYCTNAAMCDKLIERERAEAARTALSGFAEWSKSPVVKKQLEIYLETLRESAQPKESQ
jgi:hypothetical protein